MNIKINSTEQEALESGDSWIDGDIYRGHIPFNRIKYFKPYELSLDERGFLDEDVNELCRMIDNETIHRMGKIPEEYMDFIKLHKFFGLCIPKQYGGLGYSHLLHSKVVERIASCSIPVAVTVMVPNSLGPAELLLKYGTTEQKDYWLPRLATGEEIPCFALTSTNAGSDAAGSQDSFGIVQRDGSIKLYFEKRFITLAPIATCIGVAFRLFDPYHVYGIHEDLGITVAILRRDMNGLSIGMKHDPLGVPFENGPILGNGVTITQDDIIGGNEGIGNGWKMLVECLGVGRSISLPSLSSGLCKTVLTHIASFILRRKQFGANIAKFEGNQEKIAEMMCFTYLCTVTRNLTVSALDEGITPAVLSAIAKYNCTELGRSTLNHGMDINAGPAIILGERNKLARYYQSAPISITVEGANTLTRNLIIYGQGTMKNHPYVYKLIMGIIEKFQKQILFNAIGFGVFTIKTMILSFIKGYVSWFYRSNFEKTLNMFSSAFAFVTNILLITMGQNLKKNEFVSGRMSDIFSHIYMGIAHIKDVSNDRNISFNNATMNNLMEYTRKHINYRIQESFFDLFDNLRGGFLLKWFLFPFGRKFKKPSDALIGDVVSDLCTNETMIWQLTKNTYRDTQAKSNEIIGFSSKKSLNVRYKTIADLHKLYKSGIIDEREYSDAKQSIIDRHESLKVNHNGDEVVEHIDIPPEYDFRS